MRRIKAALSTADGLLPTISNALSHDLYREMIQPRASAQKRVTITKILVLVVAPAAATVASQKPARIRGIPPGFVMIIVVSLLTPPPDKKTQAMVEKWSAAPGFRCSTVLKRLPSQTEGAYSSFKRADLTAAAVS